MEGAARSVWVHPWCQELGITHICFADDVTFFCNGSDEAVINLKQTIECFPTFRDYSSVL